MPTKMRYFHVNRKKAFYNVFLTTGHSNLFIVLFGKEFHLANASKEDGYLYYNPASLPYNPTAPLRNSIPYIPLEIDEKGVRISNVIPPEYINRHIRDYVEEVNRNYTENDLQEIRLIQENLKLSTISKNLMMLGSVLEDDAISLSSEDETPDEEMKRLTADISTEEYQPHYPPRTLREIYSLPHKNRGDLKDGLAVSAEELSEVLGVVQTSELSQADLDTLLTEGSTADMNDVRLAERNNG